MEEKSYITPPEVMSMWGLKKAKAYALIHRANEELKAKGFFIVPGKCPRNYFIERMGLKYTPENAQ